MKTISVRRFKNQHVAGRRRFGIAKDRHVGSAEVAAEKNGGGVPARRIFHPDCRRSQNVSGVVEGSRHSGSHFDLVTVTHASEATDDLPNLVGVIKGSDTRRSAPLL